MARCPKDYPPWKQVYNTSARWRQRGVWDVLLALLRQQVCIKACKHVDPSVAIIDAQSVKTVLKGGSVAMTLAKRPKAMPMAMKPPGATPMWAAAKVSPPCKAEATPTS